MQGRGLSHGGDIRARLAALAGRPAYAGDDPGYVEAVLRLRAKRLAQPRVDDDAPRAATIPALCVRVADERYALPLDRLAEVMPLGAWSPVPGQSQHLLGVTNVRGEIRPVLDLHSMLGLAAPEDGAATYVVFLRHDNREVGLRVDELDRIRDIGSDDLTNPTESANGLPQRFAAGITPDTLVLLDVPQILALDVLKDRGGEYLHRL